MKPSTEPPRPFYLLHQGDCYVAFLDDQNQFDIVEIYPGNRNVKDETLQWNDVPSDLQHKFEDLRIRRLQPVPPPPVPDCMSGLEDDEQEQQQQQPNCPNQWSI